jgi:hypothetical protein
MIPDPAGVNKNLVLVTAFAYPDTAAYTEQCKQQ